MKQIPKDTYSVAWFKLAECITRGEKERALGVYRLLAHSIEDDAYACKLEADILLAFNDIAAACVRYDAAASLYIARNKHAHARLLYTQLIMLKPDVQHYRDKLNEIASQANVHRNT